MTRVNRLGQYAKRLWACERGAAAPIVGLCAIVLVGAVGVAIDIGRGQVAQSKLQASLDSAGLAAGAMVSQNLSEDMLKPEAEKYLNANFAGETIEATISDFDLDLSEDGMIVTLDAEATLPTTLMRIFGKTQMTVAARSEITREMTGLEVALVLDVTGSMDDEVGGTPYDSTKKIAALRTAGTDLVNILFGSNDEVDDLWVGVVPFSQSVNIGTDRTDWMEDLENYTDKIYCSGSKTSGSPVCPDDSYTISSARVSTRTNPITRVNRYMDADPSDWYFKDPVTGERHGWGGCVLERWDNNRDVTDDPPSTQKWETYFVPDTSASGNNNWRGPDSSGNGNGNYRVNNDIDRSANKGCPQQAITPLSNKKADLLAAINNLVNPRGNTHIPVGAVWGWRLLSPEWTDLWGGDMDANNLPLEYDDPLSQKAMILMTDGINTMSDNIYTAYGWLSDGHLGTTSSESTARATLNAKTKTICDAMKAKGILIYSIVFGNGSDTTSKNLMKNCASETDFYFFSPSKEALQAAFKAIGDSLSKLRVSK